MPYRFVIVRRAGRHVQHALATPAHAVGGRALALLCDDSGRPVHAWATRRDRSAPFCLDCFVRLAAPRFRACDAALAEPEPSAAEIAAAEV